jgi:hypothetical protein
VTAIIVGGLVVVVVLAIVWLRYRAARSDRRSMETYGHALGVLGSVAKRTGRPQSVRVLPRAEPGQAHVRTGGTGAVSPARAARPLPPSASIPVRQHVVSFDDSGEEWAGAGRPVVREPAHDGPPSSSGDEGPGDRRAGVRHEAVPAFRPQGNRPGAVRRQHDPGRVDAAAWPPVADVAASDAGIVLEPPMLPSVSPEGLRRQASVRRLATGGFAALAVAAIVLAAIELSGAAHTAKSPPPTSLHPSTSTSAPSTTAARPTTTSPAVIEPISTSGNDVTFQAPAGDYVLTFATSGQPCWVGVETGVGTSDFLWTQAVQPGSDATYKAAGSLVVNVGAAEYLSVSVNGVPIRIPSGVTTGYISFVAH